MSALPYHKRYHSDALAGFMPLTLEERGAYQTILDMIYDRGGPLIDNERLLAGYMNCSIRKWRQLREILIDKGKISIDRDGLITNRRARKEIENQSKTSRKLSEAGSKGAQKRIENENKPNEINGGEEARPKAGLSKAEAILEARSQRVERVSPPKSQTLPDDVRLIMDEGGFVSPPPDLALLKQWYAAGANLEQDILPTVRAVRARLSKAPFKLKVFDGAIHEKLAVDAAEIERLRGISARYEREEQQQQDPEEPQPAAAGAKR